MGSLPPGSHRRRPPRRWPFRLPGPVPRVQYRVGVAQPVSHRHRGSRAAPRSPCARVRHCADGRPWFPGRTSECAVPALALVDGHHHDGRIAAGRQPAASCTPSWVLPESPSPGAPPPVRLPGSTQAAAPPVVPATRSRSGRRRRVDRPVVDREVAVQVQPHAVIRSQGQRERARLRGRSLPVQRTE